MNKKHTKRYLKRNQERRVAVSKAYGSLHCPHCPEQRPNRQSLDRHILHVHGK